LGSYYYSSLVYIIFFFYRNPFIIFLSSINSLEITIRFHRLFIIIRNSVIIRPGDRKGILHLLLFNFHRIINRDFFSLYFVGFIHFISFFIFFYSISLAFIYFSFYHFIYISIYYVLVFILSFIILSFSGILFSITNEISFTIISLSSSDKFFLESWFFIRNYYYITNYHRNLLRFTLYIRS